MDIHHSGLTNGPVYLDYNATTPVDPRAAEALQPYLTTWFGNPVQHPRLRRRTRRGAAYRSDAGRRAHCR